MVKQHLKKTLRIIKFSIFIILLLFLVLVGVVNLPFVHQIITSKANGILEKRGIPLHIEKVTLLLNGNIGVTQAFLFSALKDTIVYVDKVQVDLSVSSLLNNKIEADFIKISDAIVDIKTDSISGKLNIISAFKIKAEPDTIHENDSKTAKKSWDFGARQIQLKNIHFKYSDKQNGLVIDEKLDKAEIDLKTCSILNQQIDIENASLVKPVGSVAIWETASTEKNITESKSAWKFSVNKLEIANLDFALIQPHFNQKLKVALNRGELSLRSLDINNKLIDVNYIKLKQPEVNILKTSDESKEAKSENGEISIPVMPWNIIADEIDLRNGSFDILYPENKSNDYFPVTGINTKMTSISLNPSGNHTVISEMAFSLNRNLIVNSGSVSLKTDSAQNINLASDITISVEDLAEKSFAEGRYDLSININGSVEKANIEKLTLSNNRGLIFALQGSVSQLSEFPESACDVYFQTGSVSKQTTVGLLKLAGQRIDLPEYLPVTVSGSIKGNIVQPVFNLNLKSQSGNLAFSGIYNTNNQSVNVKGSFNKIKMKELFGDNLPESINGSFQVSGKSKKKSIDGKAGIIIDSVTLNNKTTRNIRLDLSAENNQFEYVLAASDTALNGELKGTAGISNNYYNGKIAGNLKINPFAIGLTEFSLAGSTKINAGFSLSNKEIKAETSLTNLILSNGIDTAKINHVSFQIDSNDTISKVNLDSDFLSAHFRNNSSINEFFKILKNSNLGSAFNLDSTNFMNIQAVSKLSIFDFTANFTYHPVINLFIPDTVLNFSVVHIKAGKNATDSLFQGNISTSRFDYSIFKSYNPEIKLITDNDKLKFELIADSISGSNLTFGKLMAGIDIMPEKMAASVEIQNQRGTEVYDFGIDLMRQNDGIVLKSSDKSWLLNGYKWNLENSELLTYLPEYKDILFDINLENENRTIQIVGRKSENIKLKLREIGIEKLITNGILPYKTSGVLNADIDYYNLNGNKFKFNIDLLKLNIDSLHIEKIIAAGDFFSDSTGVFKGTAMVTVNDTASLKIDILKETKNSYPSINSTFSKIPFNLMEPFIKEYAQSIRGTTSGELTIISSDTGPDINGEVRLQNMVMKIVPLNVWRFISDDKIIIKDNIVLFNNFTIIDSLSNPTKVNGKINLSDSGNETVDIQLNTQNVRLLHTTEKDNKGFHGTLLVSSDLRIYGDLKSPSIKGNINLDKGTNLTYQRIKDLSVKGYQKDVLFAKFDDSLNIHIPDELADRKPVKMPMIQTTIRIDPKSIFNVRIEDIYDIDISLSGDGTLDYNLLSNNTTSLNGEYSINQGNCKLKITGWPQKLFTITPGSKFRWNGAIENPDLNIEAVSKVRGSYLNPIDNKNHTVDFLVSMKILNKLENLALVFDIGCNDQYITSVVNSLSDDEKMRQSMNLLLFETIELPGIENSSNYMAEQINSFWESQLNNLTRTSLKNTDLSFGIDTYNESTKSGTQEKTSFTYEMEQKLFNDRATVKISGRLNDYGETGYKTNSIFDNFIFEYELDKKGNKFLKLYQKKDYQDMLEGEVIKYGAGFLYRKNYTRLKDIWTKKKKQQSSKQPEGK